MLTVSGEIADRFVVVDIIPPRIAATRGSYVHVECSSGTRRDVGHAAVSVGLSRRGNYASVLLKLLTVQPEASVF